MAYWLMKSEPGSYSWDDLVRDGGTDWDGVRNNAARLHLRAMKPGDEAFFYHSMEERAVVGIMRITGAGQPDGEDGSWVKVPVEPVRPLNKPVTLAADQGRAEARQDGADPPVAPVGRAGARRGMEAGPGDGASEAALSLALPCLLTAAAPAPTYDWKLTPAGWGPVRIGMNRDQVSKALKVELAGRGVRQ